MKKTLKLNCFLAKALVQLQGIQNIQYITTIFTHLVPKLYKNKICDVHLKLRLMLQSRAKYTVFVACQLYQRNFCDVLEMKFTSPLGVIQQACAPKQLGKALLLVLLSVSDNNRVYTSLYFIITNFHTEHKPQVKFSAWHEFSSIYIIHNV